MPKLMPSCGFSGVDDSYTDHTSVIHMKNVG